MNIFRKQSMSRIEFLARKNYYTLELLRGYCQNYEGEGVDASFIVNVLDIIFNTQRHLLNQIDIENIKLLKQQ